MPTPRARAVRPLTAHPNTTHYEWAGRTLSRLLGMTQPVSETWAFFSGPSMPARLAGSMANGRTMAELVAKHPDMLGPAGVDPRNRNQKYFFVKFLDPSDFPPFAYVGFKPGAATRRTASLRARVAALLWEDRQAVARFAELVRPRVRSRTAFLHLKAAYKAWAIAQARRNWRSRVALDMRLFVAATDVGRAHEALARQQRVRRALTGMMHRIDFKADQAILIETPTLHAIAGLSLQLHPKTASNYHPKDELWIYKRITHRNGTRGWLLVEPQRTFDKTESGADFFTPYAWRGGRFDFRKPITRSRLRTFVRMMDATPHPRRHYIRRATRMRIQGEVTTGAARWYRLVEESGWPYFRVRELRFGGPGSSTTPVLHRSFTELHATQGTVRVTLRGRHGTAAHATVTPASPLFLPANLPYETITYSTRRPAQLQSITR